MNSITQLKTSAGNRFDAIHHSALGDHEKATLINLCLDVLEDRYQPGKVINNPRKIADFLRLKMANEKNEIFGAVFMNSNRAIISVDDLFRGTINGAAVPPRVVVQKVMECNAAMVIFYHNHPSGLPTPSEADKHITMRLKSALSLIDVCVVDHIVVGNGGTVSFAERGFL